MGSILLRLRAWWETADRTQKVVTLFGSAFLVFLLIGTYYFASKPKMAMVYGGLNPADQGKVVSEIQKLGIPVEYDVQGNVKVPNDKIAEVQAMLARNGVTPTSGHMGSKDLGGIGIMSPKSVTDAQLNAVRQGEISATLESINGVAAAKVLLSGGDRGPFSVDDEAASASVTITEESGAQLSGAPAKSMAQLVARAVPGLLLKNVTIVNQDGMTLFDGAAMEGANALSSEKISAQISEAQRIKRELQPLLDKFGAGNTMLTVRVEMDFDKKAVRNVKIEPHKQPLSMSTSSEDMTGNTPAARGIAGSNGQEAAPGATEETGKDSKYIASQTQSQFPYDHTTSDVEKAPGQVTGVAISILVNSDAPEGQDPIDPVAVEDAVKGYLGTEWLKKDSYSVTVTPAKFDTSTEKELKAAATAAAGRDQMQQMMSFVPIVALVLVAFLVLRALKKVATASNVVMTATPDGRMIAMPAGQMKSLPGSAATEVDEWEEVDEINEEDPEGPPVRKKRKKKRPIEEDEDDDIYVGRISEKVNVPLEQLKKMATNKPEAIAMLLKSWLIEERR